MKLLQLNTWAGRLKHQMYEMFENVQPDIACLQETISFPPGKLGFMASVQEYQEKAGFPHTYFSPGFHFAYMNHTAGYGNTILSKYPISFQKTLFTYGSYIENFDIAADKYDMRLLQHVTIETPEGPVQILNHHGYHNHAHKNGDDETMRQCKEIIDYIKTLDGKIILCGDFNLSPHSESLEQINAELKNLSIQARLKTTRNNLTSKTEVCDYIFVNDAVRVKKFEMLEAIASDHNALMLDFS